MSDLLERRLSTNDILRITTWSRWTLKRHIANGNFPLPERIGPVKHDLWRQSVIEKWLEENTYVPEAKRYGT